MITNIKLKNISLYNQSLLISFLFFFLFLVKLHTKTFFDDELATIYILNKHSDIFSLYNYINEWDVSPPLSYLLIYIGSKIFSYQYVPIIFLPLQLFCLIKFADFSSNYFNFNQNVKSAFKFIVILNPTFLLWCTSLRWYSIWVPLALLTISIFYFKEKKHNKDIWILLLSFSILFHISYLSIVFILSLIISNLNFFFKDLFIFIKKNIFLFTIFIIFNLPQIYFFFNVHLNNSSNQFGSYILSLVFPLITIIFGNSVFPLEIISLIYFLFFLIIIYFNFSNIKINKILIYKDIIIFFISFYFLLFTFQLGFKSRHSIILYYLFLIFVFINLNLIINKKNFFFTFVSIFILMNLLGLKNTLFQTNTIKNNINFPVKKIITFINENSQFCADVKIYTSNINLKFYLNNENKNFFINNKVNEQKELTHENCIFIVKSFSGEDNETENELINFLYEKHQFVLNLKLIEYDKFNFIKKKLFLKNNDNDFSVKILY